MRAMKTLRVSLFGNPAKVLECHNMEIPSPGETEILVRMIKSSINWSDLLTIQGAYKSRTKLPFFPGFEGVGEISELGAKVTGFAIGDRVLALRGQGTWREYTLVPAVEAILVPKEIQDDMAAQVYVNPLTAWMIIKKLQIHRGEYLLVNACGSAIGKFFCQLAKSMDFKVIALVRDIRVRSSLLSLGATAVVEQTEKTNTVELFKTLQEACNGQEIFYGLDAVGGFCGSTMLNVLAEKGRLIHYALLSGEPIDRHIDPFFSRNIKREDFHLRDWVYKASVDEKKAMFNEMFAHIIKYDIALPVARTYPLEEAEAAITHSISQAKEGKVLFRLN